MDARTFRGPWSRIFFVVPLSLAWGACATDPPPQASPPAVVTPATLPPIPRSSIVAVVLHREELGLSNDQVRDLELRDQEREKEDAAIRDEIEKRHKQSQDAKVAGANSGGAASTGGRGAGMGGRGMRGGGMRGGAPRPPGQGGPSSHDDQSLEDRTDANDTKAYLDIEDRLTSEQREKAREIASEFRAQLYDRREQLRTAAGAPK